MENMSKNNLRTLKDLPYEFSIPKYIKDRKGFMTFVQQKLVSRDELGAEAIRHVNNLMHSEYPLTCIYALKEWIMEFFNLTEEDIK